MSISTTRAAAIETPIGHVIVEHEDDLVVRVRVAGAAPDHVDPSSVAPLGREAVRQLRAYFEGRLHRFDLPLSTVGTPFQRSVWRALERIPFGETLTYGALADEVGCPGGARAVGGANGRNPFPIVVPCHRVVAAAGMGGYGLGLERKRWLLGHERAVGTGRLRA